MRYVRIGLLVVLCPLVAVGQSVPQWKVVSVTHITGSAGVDPSTILSAGNNGLYRLSAYLSATSSERQNAGYTAFLRWTDQTGLPGSTNMSVTLQNLISYQTLNPTLFSVKANTAVTGFVEISDPPAQDATWDLVVTIEKLITAP